MLPPEADVEDSAINKVNLLQTRSTLELVAVVLQVLEVKVRLRVALQAEEIARRDSANSLINLLKTKLMLPPEADIEDSAINKVNLLKT